jgi:hypothetical protein
MFWSYQNGHFIPLVSLKTDSKQEMKTTNKTGRPLKMIGQKKIYRINVKMDTREYYSLKAKAREAGMTLSECIRQSVQGSVIRQRLTPEMNDHIRKLCGMVNNLNQVARKANGGGYRNARTEYLHLADRIDNLLDRIRHDG